MAFKSQLVRKIQAFRCHHKAVFATTLGLCSTFVFALIIFGSRTRSMSRLQERNVARTCDASVASDTVVAATSGISVPQMSIIVLTCSRRDSLVRLLWSLRRAHYLGDQIDLHIWVDRSKSGHVREDIVTVASAFEWPHGGSTVHVWDVHVGIWGQWIDSWRPSSVDDAAVILEDDLEVSPLYYKWLRAARESYGARNDVFGYTLQRGTLRANQTGFRRKPLQVPPQITVFLYRLLGSWGYAPMPWHWQRFREWFHMKSCNRNFHPYVRGLEPTKWYKGQEKKRTMWTMWHIKYANDNNLFTVYANLPDRRTLAASWREPGLHYKNKGRLTSKKDFAIMEETKELPPFEESPPIFNWNGMQM